MAAEKRAINVILGAMTSGKAEHEGIRVTSLDETEGKDVNWLYAEGITNKSADVRKDLMQSLKALKTDKIRTFYLHGSDRTTPYEETLREVNALDREGYFKRFGVSNYQSWQVAHIENMQAQRLGPAHRLPGSLQCLAPRRRGRADSLPAQVRHLADEETEDGSRFDRKTKQGALQRGRYWNDAHFGALDLLRPVAAKHGINQSGAALRWLAHLSALSKDQGDGVIIGASSVKHLEENLIPLEKGPLPDDVVEALN